MDIGKEHFFSPSEIGEWIACPTRWWKRRSGAPRIAVEKKYMDFGTLFHDAIKEYYEVITERPPTGVIEGTFKTILDRRLKDKRFEGMKQRIERCTRNFIKFETMRRRTWRQYKPTLVETKLAAEINGVRYVNIVDAYWEKDQHSVDWKTGAKNRITDIDRIQGTIGQMVLAAHGKICKKTTFVCLYTGMFLPMPRTSVEFVEGHVKDMVECVRKRQFLKKRHYCSSCEFSLSCAFEDRGICMWM